jgi:PhnB protein
MQINSYLSFNGDCEKAFRFYEKHFGGQITAKVRYSETPLAEQVPAEWRAKIIHAALKVGENILMGGDAMPGSYIAPQGFSLSLGVADQAEVDRIFAALAEQGTVEMPLQQTFWALRFGMVKDQFGIPWMISYEKGV